MIRLSRVGRQHAIINAVRKLTSERKQTAFTKGEICKVMGIKSTSRIRDMLRYLVECELLVSGSTALDGYAHEVEVFGLPHYVQTPLPDNHIITINGVTCRMSGEVVQYA